MSIVAGESPTVGRTSPHLFAAGLPELDLRRHPTLDLDDPDRAWLVESGHLDVFAVGLLAGGGGSPGGDGGDGAGGGPGQPAAEGRWDFLCRLDAGSVLPAAPPGPRHTLRARATPGSVLRAVPVARLAALARPGLPGAGGSGPDAPLAEPLLADPLRGVAVQQLAAGLDATVDALDAVLHDTPPPRDFLALDGSGEVALRAGRAARAVSGVLWARAVSGDVGLDGLRDGRLGRDRPVPLPEGGWLRADGDAVLRLRTTAELLDEGTLLAPLRAWLAGLLAEVDRLLEQREARETQTLRARGERNAEVVSRAARGFARLLISPADAGTAEPQDADPVMAVARLVARPARITLRSPEPGVSAGPRQDALSAIAQASRVRTREVRLEGSWWRHQLGPMVGYLREDGRPVALLPRPGGYVLRDPGRERASRLDFAVAAELEPTARVLYRPLPERTVTGRQLLRFGLLGSWRDLSALTACGFAVALIGLAVPVLTGTVLGQLVPRGERHLILLVCLAVMGSAVVVAPLSLVQNIAALRVEGRVDAVVQAALWDRLLALPVAFFSRYSTGELSTAALGINGIREALSGVAVTATLNGLFGLVTIVLLFLYSGVLALVALALVGLGAGVVLVAGVYEVRRQRELYTLEQRLSSKVFQMLTGLSKLRVAAAEDRAFADWAGDFTRNRLISLQARRAQNAVTVFNGVYTLVCTLVLFAVVGFGLRGHLSTSAFLSFNVAFGQLLASTLQLTGALITVLAVVPMFERITPILSERPEVVQEQPDPGELRGDIEVSHVSFRYRPDGPLVLEDLCLSTRPGDFLAIVGPTGCGKSTLLRVLLGFEQPVAGSVLYDGQDLTKLDVTSLRRQCGVVLQNGQLFAGDLLSNIVGSGTYSTEDAWEAASMAGLDEDISRMPMGMNTVLSEGAVTLSAGQRQRLMIARALIARPRILFLDEATSALDNPTQRVVAESMRRLNATRIVIAHRLSTVVGADRILVLDGGRVIQEGDYQQLMAVPDGMFARLVRRQLA